ncbi:dephospho-CoA kinase [Pragia fontium]|uniref:Dephospho-CoA kinase n=1 Tax=Pragia fontium DSM 5563 = ATCC 49100 TaxID=1122977 RepID=A0AAJ4W7J2_9GAMM|nr:dephospho-CoA kinase [Pragia fontium]SFB99185.1 dephospho-CoA kinase [Pragia fontium DSM 5563 = ATCC 49100]SUB81698.1 Dephospho-CoA kinase [Pragia fontium]VEJ54228.1 Dephospho-CoA kinase [Pragia fontium]
MNYIVALTGGIGSGKSTVSNAFSRLGVPVIDADIIARQVVEPGTEALAAIVQHFGPSILQPNGSLNRQKLRECIFNDSDEKLWLNSLLHPLIQRETQRQLAAIISPYVIWVVPLLIENNLCSRANRILVVDVTRETQLHRIMARDGSSEHLATQILAAQTSREIRLSYADDVLNNDDTPEALLPKIQQLHQKYLALANTFNKQDLSI